MHPNRHCASSPFQNSFLDLGCGSSVLAIECKTSKHRSTLALYPTMLLSLFNSCLFLLIGFANAQYTSEHFDDWMTAHGKVYSLPSEYDQRFQNFLANSKVVEAHNQAYEKGYTSYAMSLLNSPFSDLTDAEFEASHLMEWQNCSATTHPSSGPIESDIE